MKTEVYDYSIEYHVAGISFIDGLTIPTSNCLWPNKSLGNSLSSKTEEIKNFLPPRILFHSLPTSSA